MNITVHKGYIDSIIPPLESSYVEWSYMDPPKYTPFSFEVFDLNESRKWFWRNWTLTLYIAAVYVVLIYAGRQWMRNRNPYNLRGVLTTWNFSLALFSLVGFVRVIPELIDVLRGEDGFHRSICVRDSLNPSSAFWAMAFSVSKAIELLDTAFIVLRKTPLIFLHWYHHAATLIVSWISYPQAEPIFRYVGAMNLFVHTIMYSYYGFKAMRFNPPRNLAMIITLLQLSQMALGLTLNSYAVYVKAQGVDCARSDESIRAQMWIYASYFILFANYFYNAYFSSSRKFKSA